MKAFNLSTVNITVADQVKTVISLGEKGRARVNTLVPCPQGLQDGSPVTLVNFPAKSTGPKLPVKVVTSEEPGNQWLARISTSGAYVRGADGNVKVLPGNPTGVQVVTRGNGAFGDAGGTGTWVDLLLVVPDGTVLRVKPSRGEAYFLYFGETKVYKLTAEEAPLFDEVYVPVAQEEYGARL